MDLVTLNKSLRLTVVLQLIYLIVLPAVKNVEHARSQQINAILVGVNLPLKILNVLGEIGLNSLLNLIEISLSSF